MIDTKQRTRGQRHGYDTNGPDEDNADKSFSVCLPGKVSEIQRNCQVHIT